MAGLNYGYRNTYSQQKRENCSSNNEMNNEGVFYSSKSKKWVVRIKNETGSKFCKPFNSVAQFSDKEEADKLFAQLRPS